MSTTYPLRTLRDIFELPSHEHMERCLGELSKIMLTARATADLLVASAKANGAVIPDGAKVIEWPEVLDWIDDGKGELGCDFVSEAGTRLLSVEIVPASEVIAATRRKRRDYPIRDGGEEVAP